MDCSRANGGLPAVAGTIPLDTAAISGDKREGDRKPSNNPGYCLFLLCNTNQLLFENTQSFAF